MVKRTGGDIGWQDGRDVWYHEACAAASDDCPAEEMSAEDPLFILYTSGSTGKPKGVVHTTGGYLVYASMTHQYVFDYHDGDIYWCTADVGWVTGHSYIVYGPLANGATTLMFEGVPNYPDASRFWQVCDKHKVNHLLHRADRDPRADGPAGDGAGGKARPAAIPAHAGHGRRADQSRGLELVLRGGRRRPLPDRRHLVADRDRRHSDHAAAGRDAAESRARRPGRSSGSAGRRQRSGEVLEGERPKATCASRTAGRARCAPSTATTSASCRPISRLQGQVLHRRRLPPRRGRLLLDHRPRRRRDQRVGPPHGHGGGRKRPGEPTTRWRKPRSSAIRTTSRARASTPMSP